MVRISWKPGVVNANTNIDLPSGAPRIDAVVSASIWRPSAHNHTENTAAAYEQNATTVDATQGFSTVATVPTKVDADTITLDVATLASDELTLNYIAEGERLKIA